jgi:hypothetical protein
MADWSKTRSAQHAALYPAAQRSERNRLAQARYPNHAERDAKVRVVVNILRRQSSRPDDVEQLAAALHELLGTPFSKALVTELRHRTRGAGGSAAR